MINEFWLENNYLTISMGIFQQKVQQMKFLNARMKTYSTKNIKFHFRICFSIYIILTQNIYFNGLLAGENEEIPKRRDQVMGILSIRDVKEEVI